MSVYDDLASILRKAHGSITEEGGRIDVGREVVMLRSAHEKQVARIAELEKVAEAAKGIYMMSQPTSIARSLLEIPLRAAGYLGGEEK